MKTIFLFALICLLSAPGQASALRATTVENSIACVSESALDEMFQFTASGDADNFNVYIRTRRCFRLKGGADVTVIDSPGMFGGKSSFIINGLKFWTPRDGLTNYRGDDSEKKSQPVKTKRDSTRIPTAEEQAAEWKKAQEIFNKKR